MNDILLLVVLLIVGFYASQYWKLLKKVSFLEGEVNMLNVLLKSHLKEHGIDAEWEVYFEKDSTQSD